MIVRNIEEARKTERLVTAENGNWDSTRLVLANDGGNFSFHITRIFEGTETHIHYKHHYESVYCIEGEGEVETLADGKIWPTSSTSTMNICCVRIKPCT